MLSVHSAHFPKVHSPGAGQAQGSAAAPGVELGQGPASWGWQGLQSGDPSSQVPPSAVRAREVSRKDIQASLWLTPRQSASWETFVLSSDQMGRFYLPSRNWACPGQGSEFTILITNYKLHMVRAALFFIYLFFLETDVES